MANKNTCVPSQKTGVKGKTNIGSISSILKLISAAFLIGSQPAPFIPPPLIFVGGKIRPGLSPKKLAARMIARQSEAGKVAGNVYADGPNTDEAMIAIICEEVINTLITEAKIDVVIDPFIPVTVIGNGNLGLPVLSKGATTSIANGVAVIS